MYLHVHATSFLVQVWIGLQWSLFLGFLSFNRTPRVLLCNKPLGTFLPVMHTSPFCLIHFYVFHILMSFIACKKYQHYDFRYSLFLALKSCCPLCSLSHFRSRALGQEIPVALRLLQLCSA